MEPLQALSIFTYLSVLAVGPVAWGLLVFFKRRWGRAYDGTVEASSEEILEELDREFAPSRRTTLRTQTEYLPFLFECIRENIDSGFEDTQMISLLERIEFQRPGQERGARFTVVARGRRSQLHIRWVRDSCSRICLHFEGAPSIIRALRRYRGQIPGAVVTAVG